MAVSPVQFFIPAARADAATALAAAPTPTAAAAATTAANPTTTATFSAVLGDVLAQLGPLAFDTTLTTVGAGNNSTVGGLGGLTNTLFTLLLLNTLGLGQSNNTSLAVQQLLVTQLLLGATGTTDTLGLSAIAEQQFAAALAQQQPVTNNLLTQTASVSTQPNPIVFSAGVLAQAFQVGNGTGSPA